MKAARVTDRGGPEVLRIDEVPDPTPGPDELLVRVRAAALNRADLLQCMGLYPAPPGAPADIPGLEYAGEVLAVGARVTRFRPGERVMGLVGGGAFGQLVVTHEREAIASPGTFSLAEAAAIPEAFITAFDALVLQGGLRSGEAVLIHAAGSGVGTAAVQLASALGALTVGTARSAEKLERATTLGLSHAILCRGDLPDFAAQVRSVTGGRGVDLVLDLVGGGYTAQTLQAMASRARLLLVGLLAGPATELSLATVLTRRLTLIGTVLRSRPLEERITVAQAFAAQVVPLLAKGQLKPVIHRIMPMAQIAEALGLLAANETFGKVVVEW